MDATETMLKAIRSQLGNRASGLSAAGRYRIDTTTLPLG